MITLEGAPSLALLGRGVYLYAMKSWRDQTTLLPCPGGSSASNKPVTCTSLPSVATAEKWSWERALEQVRRQYAFFVTGYVVMPEHVHLLVSEPEQALKSK